MRKAAIIALMTLCLPAVAQTDKQEPAVVILTAGQSNTDGRVGNEELPGYIRRDGYKYCQWSFGSGVHSGNGEFKPFFPRIHSQNKPERWAYDAVVYYLLEQQLQRPFYVIKESLGGTGKRMFDCIQTKIKHQGPTMGWSSWNTYRVNISDSLIKQQADACTSLGLKNAGYTYINIDDGYFGGRDEKTGRLLIHPKRFPKGLKPVVDHIHGLGLKAGIYSDAGANTCGCKYDNDTIARGVGLYGHDQQDADMFFKELGFDFIKIDFCGGSSTGNDDYLALDPRERYTAIRKAIINTGRNDVRMNVCRWDYPGTWVNSVAQSWRMSHDISARWSSVKDIIQQNLYLSAYAKDGHYNDMDMLEVGRTLTAEEDRTHFGMWCIMSSPLLISCDMTKLKPETLELLKNQELIALNQDPLGLQAYVAKHDQTNGTYVLAKDILQTNGLTRAVALYNPTDVPTAVSISFADLEMGGQVKVRDVFARADVKLSKNASGLNETVPAHGCRIYTLTASKRLPRKLYEAETAWLSAYQELYNAKAVGTAYYEKDSLCSGGMKVTNLGYRPDNDLQWQNVYVDEDGMYQLRIKCLSFADGVQLYIAKNGEAGQRFTLKDSYDGNIYAQLHLRKGQNTIRLYNDHGPMPEIDYMEIMQTEKAEWISVKDAPVVTGKASVVNRAADGASWFVTTVENEKEVVSAKWTTTALGVYELYLNGKPVGEEILKPGFTHYAKTRRAFTHDVTALLKKGKGARNQLAAQVTPGWWADKIITPNNYNGMLGGKCAFRCVLELTFADGSRQCFSTNRKDWLAGIAGPVRHAAIFDGEEYDARKLPGYADVSQLKEPELNTAFKGEILPSEGAEVYLRKDLTLQPVKAYVWQGVTGAKASEQQEQTEHGTIVIKRNYSKGETISLSPGETLVVDFGQNSAAVPSFVFKAKAGTKLTCLPSEILNDGNGAESRGMDGPEGSVHRRNLRMQEDGIRIDYTFADSKNFVSYRTSCTFFGYRYISVTATDKVQIKKIESIPVSSITKEMETGSITTGNELINQLISNTLWGQRSNYLSVPTDCPQRNERLGWTADTQVFAETGSFFANTDRFFHKWMRDMRDTQSEQGGFPGVAPSAQYGSGAREMMRIGWADAGVIVPWTVWKQFGDISIIDENWEAMERFILHVNSTRYDHQALAAENGNYQWADWLSYEPLESCGRGAFDKNGPLPDAITYWNYLGASYWAIDAAMMADMAKATGRDATRYQQMAKTAREYLKEQFLDNNGNFRTAIFNTMQTPALFALRNGLVEGDTKQRLIKRLRENFADHGNCLQTGFLGTSILMHTLTDNGMADIAYELLFQRKNPSWLYSIDNGATTIWERWNSYMIEHGMGPKGMNSFNHYAYGCVCQWLWETVAGIAADTANPGFRHIVMKPLPDKRLGYVKAEYKSAAGIIKSHWRYEGNQWIWDFTIPEGATATVTLPGETESKEYKSGSHRITSSL